LQYGFGAEFFGGLEAFVSVYAGDSDQVWFETSRDEDGCIVGIIANLLPKPDEDEEDMDGTEEDEPEFKSGFHVV
jgi:hypothetical protein